MRIFIIGIWALATVFCNPLSASVGQAAELNVVSSIRPVNSLVASVMQGVGKSELLISGGQSPHSVTLKPSQARALQKADLVFWIGPSLESFLSKSLSSLAPKAHSVRLMKSPGLHLIEISGEDAHGHHDHDNHADHDDEAEHEGHDDHDEHGDHDTEGSHGGRFDSHIWLDPDNAIAMVKQIARELGEVDAQNAAIYSQNAEKTKARLETLKRHIAKQMKQVSGRPFMVFHQAYGYFEHRFKVKSVGVLSPNPELGPTAGRLRSLAQTSDQVGVRCVFSEPQFDAGAWTALAADHNLKIGVLDPVGQALQPGPDLYFELIQNLATAMTDCLSD